MDTPVKEKAQGLLKVIFQTTKGVEEKINNALKVEDNKWKYVRSNGQVMKKKSTLDPKQMAIALGEVYHKREKTGEIRYRYFPSQ